MSFVSHVECTICGARHDAKRPLTVCEQCGEMLAVRYDLERVKASVTKDALRRRAPGMYRFRELTPVDDSEERVTLGEGGTPLLELPRLAAHLGVRRLWAKDEGQNPTGSFKARGLGMAIRSEEHTSELQSRFDLVCRLLLENKNAQRYVNAKRFDNRLRYGTRPPVRSPVCRRGLSNLRNVSRPQRRGRYAPDRGQRPRTQAR